MKKNFLLIYLCIVIFFPSLLTLIYFVMLSGDSGDSGIVQKLVYGLGKVIQFLLPLFWIFFITYRFQLRNNESVDDNITSNSNKEVKNDLKLIKLRLYYLFEGLGFGVIVFVMMFLLYYFCFSIPGGELSENSAGYEMIKKKISQLGLTDWRLYFLFGVFYSVIHSGLEEYYWRWFLFRKLQEICKVQLAIIISGLGFALHHVILLRELFGLNSLLCILGSAAVAIGGIYWARLYQRSGNLYAAWIGHGIVDAAIFSIGYMICFA
ncbi:MAG: CPBP family intramembrane metalloprotease [Planctomycetaceae bacterium]|nr:CPBP family intramembrane metalloprotease [Planctomycetaceae bacterium]